MNVNEINDEMKMKKSKEEKVEKKRKEEQHTVTVMIKIYCHGNHKDRNTQHERNFMCSECRELAEYAMLRSRMCPYIKKGTKTFCSCCKTPCYKDEYRQKIKKVMRYAGPRLLFLYPWKLLNHHRAEKKFKLNVSHN